MNTENRQETNTGCTKESDIIGGIFHGELENYLIIAKALDEDGDDTTARMYNLKGMSRNDILCFVRVLDNTRNIFMEIALNYERHTENK